MNCHEVVFMESFLLERYDRTVVNGFGGFGVALMFA